MISFDADGIYALLPAWIRVKDQEQEGALKALIGVIASQAEIIEDNLDQLYDDQFVETCQPWVIPYIGDLIGFKPLRPPGPGRPAATRAEVANTIGYRRRKGTRRVLEQLAFDVTKWPSVAVEYFTRLSTTQYVRNHIESGNAIVEMHSPGTAIDIGSAFDLAPRSADMRRIASGRGRYNIPNIGVFVWRLATLGGAAATQPTPTGLDRTTAPAAIANRYTFDPFGDDVPLVNPPQRTTLFALAQRVNMPFKLARYPLYAELEAARAAFAAGAQPQFVLFADPPVFTVYEADGTAIDPRQIAVCDLTNWAQPTQAGIRVSVDPELGRFVFATPTPAVTDRIRVAYAYGFSGHYGGGAYVRPNDPGEALPALVIDDFAAADLTEAKDEVVEIDDSGIHAGDLTLSPDANKLVIRAADFARPVIAGSLTINAVPGASVTLRGLGLGGSLTIAGAGPLTLTLEHCTIRGKIAWPIAGGGSLTIDHSLCAALEVNETIDIVISDSAVDAGTDTSAAVSAGGSANCGSVVIARSTILGTIAARELPLLENSICTGVATSLQRQEGCVRYSYVPPESVTPRRFRCQPNTAVDAAVSEALKLNPGLTAAERDAIAAGIEAWLVPSFTSRRKGDPGYLQLADFAPDAIRYGAEDGDEMGVFFDLFGPRKEANLNYRLGEYIRIGLEFGIIHAA